METVTNFLAMYVAAIEIPLGFIQGPEGFAPGIRLGYDIFATIVVLSVVMGVFNWLKGSLRWIFRGNSLLDRAEIDAVLTSDDGLSDTIASSKRFKTTATALKKSGDYVRLAEAYAARNNHKLAAKWFLKAKQRKRAAEEYARAGKTLKAAKILMKEGDFTTAGDFYLEKQKHALAAKAYEKGGDLPRAATALAQGGNVSEAADRFNEYFDSARDPVEKQIEAAEFCFKMFQEEGAGKTLSEEVQKKLLTAVALRFERAKKYDLSAQLFEKVGLLERAAEVYVLGAKLEKAAQCYKAAGKAKEASRIGGRFYELKGRFKEAGMAYQGGEEYLRAAECFAKANEAVRAAECFEKAGEAFRSGLGYAHAARFEDAIRMLQRVKEDDPQFDQARGLLGRCFYELHDYAHCAATLDNHLTGKRVESGNAEFYYMLALASEQLGKLDVSREILYKLRTINVDFKDVNDRISNISSRISMRESGTMQDVSLAAPRVANAGQSQKMTFVDGSVGERYVLERELGRGGMGEVYLAKDTQLDRYVAIKFLGSLIDDSEEFRQRFIREAKAAAKINHPNIVSIYDINATKGKTYIAMEYVEGTNLHGYVKHKGKLPAREAVNLIGQACGALAAIHEAGIVHRDIKPDNILVSKGGLVKLTDFGLAKAEDNRMTKAGTVLGTPSYMSPEQVRGEDVSHLSDVYSLGLVLHEALTGKTVFDSGDVLKRQISEVPPPPSAAVEDVPELLDSIVMRCVSKDPSERFQSARELMDALRQVGK